MKTILEPRVNTVGSGTAVSASKSAASWAAIIAGAVVAASVSLILFALGSGLGFASISPWPNHGVSVTTFAVSTAIWLIVMQWISACVGGYIAGRLRTRWVGTNPHEVFFRDTAHGFVTWALATLLVASLLASSLTGIAGGGAHAVTEAATAGIQGAASAAGTGGLNAYGMDKLFRVSDPTAGGQATTDPRGETARILANAVATGSVPDSDRAYLANLVAARSGVAPADAQKRVDDFITSAMQAEVKAKAAADAARKAAAQLSIYTALSLLVGAFIASVSAALGGRLRDEHI